jgi:hypothetical protein
MAKALQRNEYLHMQILLKHSCVPKYVANGWALTVYMTQGAPKDMLDSSAKLIGIKLD